MCGKYRQRSPHAGDAVELYAGQSVAVFGRACARNPEDSPSAFNMERRGALGDRSCRGSAAGAELEVLLRQQCAVRQCGQLSRARLCAVLRGGGHRPRRDMGRRHHAGQQLADGAVSAGFRAVPVGRGGRPGVRRMVQDPCPRRNVHRTQSSGYRRAGRCGFSRAGAGRKHPPQRGANSAGI